MTPVDLLIILAMVGYAVYKQTQRSAIVGSIRFKLAFIYAGIGLIVGGFAVPHNLIEVAFLGFGIALSLVVGIARGRLTKVWREGDAVYSQGTPLTIGLFLGMIAIKFALGAVAYFVHVADGGGMGEVLVLIAVMVAVQAQIVWTRAAALGTPARRVPAAV